MHLTIFFFLQEKTFFTKEFALEPFQIGFLIVLTSVPVRIRMFWGLPDLHPDPLVTSTDLALAPAPDPSFPNKSVKRTEINGCKIKFLIQKVSC